MSEVLNKVTISGRDFRLQPLKGRQARLMIPKIVGLVSEVVYAAVKAGVDTKRLLAFLDVTGEASFKLESIPLDELLKAVYFITETVGEKEEEINEVVIPFLLQLDLDDDKIKKWWEEEADPVETYVAAYRAIRYHLSTTFGEATREALKKSLAVKEGATAGSESE